MPATHCTRCGVSIDLVSMIRWGRVIVGWASAIRAVRARSSAARDDDQFTFRCPGCATEFRLPLGIELDAD